MKPSRGSSFMLINCWKKTKQEYTTSMNTDSICAVGESLKNTSQIVNLLSIFL